MQSLLFSVPRSCKPRAANDPNCNPLPHTAAWLADRDMAVCAESSPGMRAFCAYAGMQADGYPSEARPVCPLTGRSEVLGPARSPSDAYVSVGPEFSCFNSSKDPKDRLCIPREYQRSIDSIFPADALPGLLHRLLAWAERDYGRAPRFQCFHRGGYGSVPWLHLHSFDGVQADSICPLAATRDGAAPNPQPLRIVCADGGQPVDRRAAQMLASMSAATDGPPPPPPPPPPPSPPPSPPPLPPPWSSLHVGSPLPWGTACIVLGLGLAAVAALLRACHGSRRASPLAREEWPAASSCTEHTPYTAMPAS